MSTTIHARMQQPTALGLAVIAGLLWVPSGVHAQLQESSTQETVVPAGNSSDTAQPIDNEPDTTEATAASAAGQETSPATDLDEATSSEIEEIVVTARKRTETYLSVPVVMSVIGTEELDRRSITSLEGIARTVPQLIVGDSSASIQGGVVALRAIGASETNPFGDQAVAFNIDGVQVARSSVRRMSEMDMTQAEVMKGPQALYYGKNSPGGIVVIRTADPTPEFLAKIGGSYETVAQQWRTDAFVSGPLTETLGARVAVFASDMKGWSDNLRPRDGDEYGPSENEVPNDREYAGRLTFKYQPSERLESRLKFTYGNVENAGLAQNNQLINCPTGTPQLGGPDDCSADDRVTRADPGPDFAAVIPQMGDGVPFGEQSQNLGGLDIDYLLGEGWALSSQTGLYSSHFEAIDNFNVNPLLDNPPQSSRAKALVTYQDFSIDEHSQELRLSSDLSGPLNYMIGAYFQKSELQNRSMIAGYNPDPTATDNGGLRPALRITPALMKQDGEAWSGFGNVMYKPIETVELSAGARYSREEKEFSVVNGLTGGPYDPSNPTLRNGTAVPKDSWSNTSPEASVTWRPTSRMTVFGSYRRGFLSGGFNAGNGNFALDRTYDEQVVEGFEVGFKGLFLDDALRINLAVYDYAITGQQVSSLVGITQVINNAAESSSSGFEADASWKTPLKGLSLRAGAAYNKAEYDRYSSAPCYRGQTIAEGCTSPAPDAGVQQDLSGKVLVRAPEWAGFLGVSYETVDGSGNRYSLAVDGNYSDDYYTDISLVPGSLQSSYRLFDASARFEMASGIEFALIGRNLGNEYYVTRTSDTPATGTPAGQATGTQADTAGAVSRGREIMLRVGVPFGGT